MSALKGRPWSQARRNAQTTHGHCPRGKSSPTYNSWERMRDRCLNPNNHKYKDYAGRGIKICKRWINSFPNFLADMGERPEGLTLERKKNNKGYYKRNCKWATRKEQANNRRKARPLTLEHRAHLSAAKAGRKQPGISAANRAYHAAWRNAKRHHAMYGGT